MAQQDLLRYVVATLDSAGIDHMITGSVASSLHGEPRSTHDDPFDHARFDRRMEINVLGTRLRVSSAEDTILAKLRWSAMSGGSEKVFVDALRIFEVQHATLDLGYVEEWADRLDVVDLWERLKAEAEVL